MEHTDKPPCSHSESRLSDSWKRPSPFQPSFSLHLGARVYVTATLRAFVHYIFERADAEGDEAAASYAAK